MADLSTYLVLALVILPPILRQAQRLVYKIRAPQQPHTAQPPSPRPLSRQRLTPFATPFTSVVSIVALLLVLISLRNLIPVRYGVDIFIPASTIEALRKSAHTLYTASSVFYQNEHVENAPLHIEAFRGGYKPDLFLAYKAPITIPTTTLRNLINDAPELLPVGLLTQAKQAELQALIARLSSYEGRRMYLLLGPAPLLDCTFCKTAGDYFWYAVPFLLGAYAWRILALGLLTTHPDDSIAVAVRQAGSLLGLSSHKSSQAQASPPSRPYEADRSGWRSSSLTVLLGSLLAELLIMFEFGQVTADSSRLNHWHSNLHITRQIVFLLLVLVIYFSPALRTLGAFEKSMLHLEATQQSLQNLMHISELTDVAHTVVLEDDGMLQTTRQWRSSDKVAATELGPDKAGRIIRAAQAQGGEAASEGLAQAQEGIRRVTRFWWQNAAAVNQQSQTSSTSVSSQPDQARRPTSLRSPTNPPSSSGGPSEASATTFEPAS